jgi:hypothetical protein
MMQNSPPRSTRQTTPKATRAAKEGQINVRVAGMNSYIDDSDNVHQNKVNITGNLAREIEGAACTAHDVRQAHWVPCASRTRREPAASTGAIASTVA